MRLSTWLCVAICLGLGMISGCLSQGESPEDIQVDVPYTVLLQWATKLNEEADEWNTRCSSSPLTQACVASHQVLDVNLTQFIHEAEKYRSNEEGCYGELRNHCVEHVVRVFKWNLLNVGKKQTVESTQWMIELKFEESRLKKEIDDCVTPAIKL